MTPSARLSAAIEVLERILGGMPAEQALTNWGRASRFAGSGDRNAVRDLVYDALRCKRSHAAMGGSATARGIILGGVRDRGIAPDSLFTGEGHAPAALTAADTAKEPSLAEALDCPDWLLPRLQAALGADFTAVMQALRHRAPVFLRVNTAKTTLAKAQAALAEAGVQSKPHALAKTALEVTENARKIQTSQPYLDGLVELQDAASQAVVEALPLVNGQKMLDYCAGGGGKTLAMAARVTGPLFAHDADPRRMRDLPDRAKRAGVAVTVLENAAKSEPYDVILTDVPCSGSGSWRRDPQGKWALSEQRLAELVQIQAGILDKTAPMLAANGVLAYATCSMLTEENEAQIQGFLARNSQFSCSFMRRFSPLEGADGFFVALLARQGG